MPFDFNELGRKSTMHINMSEENMVHGEFKLTGERMKKGFQIKVVIGQHNSVALLDCSSAIVSKDISEIGFGSWWETALPEVPVERGEWLIKGKIEEEEFSPEYYDVTFERV